MKAFYLLSLVQMISLTGSAMTGIATSIWLFEQTGSVTPVLLVAFFSSLPPMVAGALAGTLIDRWDKRRVLILADTGQAAGTLILLISLASGQFTPLILYSVVFWQSICGMFGPPIMLALISTLVPETRRERANAIQQTIHRIAGIAAPGITGLVMIFTGLPAILLIDFATFLLAVIVTAYIVPPQPPYVRDKTEPPSIWRETLEGVHFLQSQGALFGLILHGTVINFCLSSVLSLTTPYTLSVTHNEAVTGFVLSALNIGAVAGAVFIALWGGTRPRIHTIMPAILWIALAVVVYGMARTPFAMTFAAFMLLLPMPCVTTLIPAIIQQRTPPQLQGRVFAVMFQLASLANPLALLMTGVLVDRILEPGINMPSWSIFAPFFGAAPGAGMRLFIVISGLIMFLITLGVYANRGIRRVEDSEKWQVESEK